MAKRSPHFMFGNIEQVATVVEELRKTVRFYERLFGFVIDRDAKATPLEPRPLVLKKKNRGLQFFRKLGEQPRFARTMSSNSLSKGLRRIAFKAGDTAIEPADFQDANGTTLVPVPPLARRKSKGNAQKNPAALNPASRKRKIKQ
jgi:catechol 2,3-dioxygenase-like lactoylglutathione lyase family enzyme